MNKTRIWNVVYVSLNVCQILLHYSLSVPNDIHSISLITSITRFSITRFLTFALYRKCLYMYLSKDFLRVVLRSQNWRSILADVSKHLLPKADVGQFVHKVIMCTDETKEMLLVAVWNVGANVPHKCLRLNTRIPINTQGEHKVFPWLQIFITKKSGKYFILTLYIQRDATLHSLFISGKCSTCFGWYLHPSSAVHATGGTESGICHTVTATCR